MLILKKTYRIFAFSITALLILAIIAAIIYFLVKNGESTDDAVVLPKGAVVTNGHDCARIGASILQKGGSAVDAAIAALFCEGVSMPHSMGLGGGFLMTIYLKDRGTAMSLNAREAAPAAASENMFESTSSTKGGLAVAIPGELKGYWEAYNKYGGKVPWKDLVQPTIDLCKNGILVTDYLGSFFASQIDNLMADPYLKEAFIDETTNKTYTKNQYVKRLRLAEALEVIAEYGADVLYNGSLTEGFVNDVREKGGIITVEDMNNYKVEWQEAVKYSMPFDQTLYSVPLPGSGIILGFIMNILSGFLDHSQPTSIINWQRIVESFKYGYGRRTELGDTNFLDIASLLANLTSEDYAHAIRSHIFDNQTFQEPEHYGASTVQPEDHGTAHVSVLAPNGDAVSVTSTINLYFGAGFMSATTGIILNDEMDDFSSPNITNAFGVPPSVANFIKPGKRPLSSMCPVVVARDDGEVELVIGAAGGTKITTSVAQIIIKNLWFNSTIQDAVSDRRLHHQLFPMAIQFEEPFENDLEFVEALHGIGHEYNITASTGFSAVTAISRKDGVVRAATDKRRSGSMVYVF